MKITKEKSEYGKNWRKQHPDKVKANNSKRTPTQIREATASHYARNAEAIKAKKRAEYAAKTPAEKAILVARHRKWRHGNPDKVKASARKRAARPYNAEKAREARKKFHAANPGYSTAARKKSIRKKQTKLAGRPKPKRCELCKRIGRKIVWDHCHQSGKFRGWICAQCNITLGTAGDSVKVLQRMIDYLNLSKFKRKDSG